MLAAVVNTTDLIAGGASRDRIAKVAASKGPSARPTKKAATNVAWKLGENVMATRATKTTKVVMTKVRSICVSGR